MAIVTLKEELKKAEDGNYGIGQTGQRNMEIFGSTGKAR